MRFKPPPSMHSDIGWRVELRPCEIQITDEENTSFIMFALFITRYILLFHPNFYIPISLVINSIFPFDINSFIRLMKISEELTKKMPF